jgi:methionyl-tRNA synthetase
MPKTFYITTAIDYTNSPPHIGHAYEKVLADVIARYRRLKGENVFYLTGVDQHGQKVQQSAAKAGIPPAEFVKGVTQKFVDLWKKLDVKYDAWAETIDPRHKKVVQGMLQRLFDAKQIYKDKQAGYYSIRQEQFLTEKERGPDGEFGPEWGQVEFREEENYYFKLSQHKDWLLDLLKKRPHLIVPNFRHVELKNAVERISGDLCISRPKSRLDWGIELPFDQDFVTYVWFDALTNYISFAGYNSEIEAFKDQPEEFRDRWDLVVQVIGKDILIPAHGIYWLIMLHAIGFPDEEMPTLLVHGWWNLSGAKMSKSAGNVVDPNALADEYGSEALRYYLLTDIVTGKDADFSQKRLIARYDTDLANSLGNLINRTLNMAERFGKGIMDGASIRSEVERASADEALPKQLADDPLGTEGFYERLKPLPIEKTIPVRAAAYLGAIWNYDHSMSRGAPDFAIQAIMDVINDCNRFVDESAPWKLAKEDGHRVVLANVLYHLAESARIVAILISPVLPQAAHGIFDQLNWKMELSGKEERFSLKDAEWGGLPDGHVVGKPVPLFPRIEI